MKPTTTPDTLLLLPSGISVLGIRSLAEKLADVNGDGVESNRPSTNFPGISVDTDWVDCLVEKIVLGIEL